MSKIRSGWTITASPNQTSRSCGDARTPTEALPGPDDIFLLVEIADTTLATDRDVKVPLYARAGIPEVWLIDLPHRLLHVYRAPSRDGYREVSTARPGEAVAPIAPLRCPT